MKAKLVLLIGVLVVAMAAITAVATPAEAKRGGALPVPANGTGADGEAVVGTFTIERFKKVRGVLTAVGTFRGTVDGVAVRPQKATSAVTSINGTSVPKKAAKAKKRSLSGAVAQQQTCEILDLTLGPLHLDLLGLVVDLDEVNLQITAEQGPGNLLGNLLCAVAGLLDPAPGGGGIGGLLQQIANLLNQILAILS